MILIADGGSTKTAWCVVGKAEAEAEAGGILYRPYIKTTGLNPIFQTKEEISNEILLNLMPQLGQQVGNDLTKIKALYFYGAGCIPEKIQMMKEVLYNHFTWIDKSKIEVDSDMLGAARGLCGKTPGIACILGTGSNSCFYDGEKITHNVPALGFILGDEGSGAVLGRLLVGALLKNQLSEELKKEFLELYELTPAMIIEQVYKQPFPNRFLASLSPFLERHIINEKIHELVLNAFKAFLERNVMQYDYKEYPVHFVGSVAFYYREVLEEAIHKCSMELGTIVESPIRGLGKYHA